MTDITHMDLLVTITGKFSSMIGTADVVKVGFCHHHRSLKSFTAQ